MKCLCYFGVLKLTVKLLIDKINIPSYRVKSDRRFSILAVTQSVEQSLKKTGPV